MKDPVTKSKAAPVRFENVSKVFGKDVVAVDASTWRSMQGNW